MSGAEGAVDEAKVGVWTECDQWPEARSFPLLCERVR